MIFRNDDVNPSTDLERLYELYECITRFIPNAKIISGITLFGVWNTKEAVYPDLPLKMKTNKYLYDTNRLMSRYSHVIGEIASHGMFHVNHANLSKDAQEMSIVGSCNFLKTDKFIAPFNAYNDTTIDVCVENKIELITKSHPWKCIEYNVFDSNHKYWTMHSWRWKVRELREYLNADIANSKHLGQFQNGSV